MGWGIYQSVKQLALNEIPKDEIDSFRFKIIAEMYSCSAKELSLEFMLTSDSNIHQLVRMWRIYSISIIHLIVIMGDAEILEILVKLGVDINLQLTVCSSQYVPLHYAILTKQPEMIKKIKSLGGKFNGFKNDYNPLRFALDTSHATFDACLECGSNPDECFMTHKWAGMPIMYFCLYREKWGFLDSLLKHNGNPFIKGSHDISAWDYLYSDDPFNKRFFNEPLAIELFLKYGYDGDCVSDQGETAIHMLGQEGNHDNLVRKFLTHKLTLIQQEKTPEYSHDYGLWSLRI